MPTVKKYLAELTAAIDADLLKGIQPENGTLAAAMYYALSIKGKRLRPLLFLTLLDAYRFEPLQYLDIASAIETIHTYSLIHDDLPCMDNDDLRRGFPTVHKRFNEAVAMLAGDTLLTHALERVARAPLSAGVIVEIIKVLTAGIGKEGMALGQSLDLEFSGNAADISLIHRKKTAELIAALFLAAAQIMESSPAEQKLLYEAGIQIGLGFQLADDLLDVKGNQDEVGKKVGKDSSSHRPNAALFHSLAEVEELIANYYRHTLDICKQLKIDFPPFLHLLEKMVFRSR